MDEETELRERWRHEAAKQDLTQKAFCEKFGLNKGNFCSWLQGNKSSPASVLAVRSFLEGSKEAHKALCKYFVHGKRCRNGTACHFAHSLSETSYDFCLSHLLAIEIRLKEKEGLRVCFFVDGDNCINTLDKIDKGAYLTLFFFFFFSSASCKILTKIQNPCQ
jgi:hypothetical protein